MINLKNLRKTVILITGLPYMNQKTVAEAIKTHCKIPCISLEECEHELFKEYGYLHLHEKENLKSFAIKKVQAISCRLLREDVSFCISGSLDEQWQDWLTVLKDIYGYKTFVITCSTRSFDDMYAEMLEAHKNQQPSLARRFVDGVIWTEENVMNKDFREQMRMVYNIGEYTRLIGDMTTTDRDVLDSIY